MSCNKAVSAARSGTVAAGMSLMVAPRDVRAMAFGFRSLLLNLRRGRTIDASLLTRD